MNDANTIVPVRVVRALGTVGIAEALQRATEAATAGRCHVVAGIVPIIHAPPTQHSRWQFSLSHWGQPPIAVSMHRYKRDAEAQVVRVYTAATRRELRDAAVFAALIQELAAFGNRELGADGVEGGGGA